jgi:voltage-gated potassium channel
MTNGHGHIVDHRPDGTGRARAQAGDGRIGHDCAVPDRHRAPEHESRDGTRNRQLRTYGRQILQAGTVALALLLLGATGLALSEGVDFWFAFQWALDTAATVGGFPEPRSTTGQIIQVALVLVGIGTLFYALAIVAELFVAGHLSDVLAARRMQRTIDSLTDHHIICGFGRVGRQVARDLALSQASCVVIDTDPHNQLIAEELGMAFVEGDAADDSVLTRAGVARARSVIACADSDANNVFITLTARELRADISIVARAAVEETEKKLRRAGADRVISPYKTSGREMARSALHRQLSGIVDFGSQYRIEEIEVGETCEALGSTIGEIGHGVTIVGLRRGTEFRPQPPQDETFQPRDGIVAMGTPPALEQLERMLEDRVAAR